MTPKPLTLQTAATYEEWAAKLRTVIEAANGPRIASLITSEAEADPEFAKALQGLISGSADAQDVLTTWAASKPVQAARLHRITSELPMTIAALRLAVECIQATAQDAEAIDTESITYEEARDYCARILEMTT